MTTSTEERYLVASQTSNLRVVSEVFGAGDILIASGWSPNRIGAALMRLHSKPTRDNLDKVHTQVALEANRLNIANPDAVASDVLAWWLNRICPTCFGRKFDKIENTPSLSDIECPKCHGSGEKTIPHGKAGKIMADWLDWCKSKHADMIRRRLRPG